MVVQICLKQNCLNFIWCLFIFLKILGFLYLSLSRINLSFTILVNFKARIEELQERMEKLKRELKKQKDKESSLLEEQDRLKQVQAKYLRVKCKKNELSEFLASLYLLSILNKLWLAVIFRAADCTISRFPSITCMGRCVRGRRTNNNNNDNTGTEGRAITVGLVRVHL